MNALIKSLAALAASIVLCGSVLAAEEGETMRGVPHPFLTGLAAWRLFGQLMVWST